MHFHGREILTVGLLTAAALPAVAATLVLEARLTEEDAGREHYFAHSADVDGDTAVLGTIDRSTGRPRPAALVFTRSGADWQQRARLMPADAPEAGTSSFATQVAIDGDTLVLGTVDEEAVDSDPGAAFVYTGSGGSWSRVTKLAPDPGDFFFGRYLAFGGDTLLVGSWEGTYVFERSGGDWSRQAKLPGLRPLEIDGNTALLVDAGQVVVYQREAGGWTARDTLGPFLGVENNFVDNVALDGDTAMIAGWRGNGEGPVYVHTRSGGQWSEHAVLLADQTGSGAIGISGDVALVSSGDLLRRLERSGGVWQVVQSYPLPDPRGLNVIAMSGDTAVAGAGTSGFNIGAAYVYRITSGTGAGHSLMCPGDVNGDTRPDLVVVTAQGEVSVRDTAGSLLGRFTLELTGDVIANRVLDDTNTNGSPELVTLLRAPAANQPSRAVVHDLLTGGRLADTVFAFGEPADLAVLGDMSGNGMPELAAVHLHRPVTAEINDSLTGAQTSRMAFARYVVPRSLDVFPDVDGNGRPELALLGDNRLSGDNDKVELRDPETGQVTGELWLGRHWTPLDQALTDDLDGNGAPEVAVLRTHPDGQVNVQVRDLATRRWVNSVDFTPAYSPRHLVVVADVNGNGADELVVFGPRNDGFNQKAIVRDGRTGQWLRDLWFDRHFPGRDFVSCGDLDGNGADDVALLGYDPAAGRNKVIVKDTATGQRLAMVHF